MIKILVVLSILIAVNIFVINPINLKTKQLENDKQNIVNIRNTDIAEPRDVEEEDIILRIQKELKNIVYIDYIDKKMIYDEYNNDVTSLEIKIIGNLEQIFKVQGIIDKLELSRNLKYIELNTVQNTNIESENFVQIVECIMQINVG
ncbi:MAG: hypothetical protein ACRC3Y_03940 [Romboutsia sp.]